MDDPLQERGDHMVKDIVKQLDPIFKPRSIAIIGASSNPKKWGYRKLIQPLNSRFGGPVYPVNPRETEILGLHVYPSVLDIPDDVDLAVITVPAATVPQVMAECVEKGIKGAIVISAGFAETGQEGKVLQDKVIKIAREGGIRVVGPNVLGILSSNAHMSLSTHRPLKAGHIAFISQSGTFGAYMSERAVAKGYGLSKFISIGNQADLNAADYLEYLGEDPDTKAIALYIEGFPDGRRFFKVAREIIKRKPIVIYKAGRTSAGARATLSHTGSLAGADEVFEAMCKQVGLIRAYDAMHVFDMAEVLVSQPLPRGNRVAIIGTGGQCVVTADSCASLGLEVPEFDEQTQASLKRVLPPHAPVPRNPVDWAGGIRTMLAEALVIDKIAQLNYIDGIIARPPLPGFASELPEDQPKAATESAKVVVSIPKKYGKPLIIMRSESGGQIAQDMFREARIPAYDSPEECARAMYALVNYAETRRVLEEDEHRAEKKQKVL